MEREVEREGRWPNLQEIAEKTRKRVAELEQQTRERHAKVLDDIKTHKIESFPLRYDCAQWNDFGRYAMYNDRVVLISKDSERVMFLSKPQILRGTILDSSECDCQPFRYFIRGPFFRVFTAKDELVDIVTDIMYPYAFDKQQNCYIFYENVIVKGAPKENVGDWYRTVSDTIPKEKIW